MKYLRLYDLRNETVTIIPYPTKPVDANSDPQDIQSRKKRVRRRMIRRAKRAAFVIAEVATSLASGLPLRSLMRTARWSFRIQLSAHPEWLYLHPCLLRSAP